MRFRRFCSGLVAILALAPALVQARSPSPGTSASHRASGQSPSNRVAASWPTPEARGLTTLTGLLHVHSPFSHDACNYDPLTPEGTPKPECVQRIRDAICTVPRDFFMLTDHRSFMAEQTFEDLFLFDAARGDALITTSSGEILANQITCSGDSRSWTTWLTVGLEGDHNMPVGLESHLDDPSLYGVGFGIDQDYNQQVEEIEDIHTQNGLALVAHMEQEEILPERLLALDIDGIELYNAHSNINVVLQRHVFQLLWLEPWLAGSTDAPTSDYVALLMYPYLDPTPLERWDVMTPVRATTGVIGTDVHENVTLDPYCMLPEFEPLCARLERNFPNFISYLSVGGPIPMADGERLDSYVRMFRWFSNHLRGDFQSPTDLKRAIRSGNNFVTFDILGMPEGFDFVATSDGSQFVEMGQSLSYAPGQRLLVSLPSLATVDVRGETWTLEELSRAELRAELLRVDEAGTQVVATLTRAQGTLDYAVTAPGVYRVEVYIRPRHLERELGSQTQYIREEYAWIWSNPIYVW